MTQAGPATHDCCFYRATTKVPNTAQLPRVKLKASKSVASHKAGSQKGLLQHEGGKCCCCPSGSQDGSWNFQQLSGRSVLVVGGVGRRSLLSRSLATGCSALNPSLHFIRHSDPHSPPTRPHHPTTSSE